LELIKVYLFIPVLIKEEVLIPNLLLLTNIRKDYRIGSCIKIVKELIKLARKELEWSIKLQEVYIQILTK
jgi:hypothetical protein